MYIPTIRNIINSTVIAINEHPLIKDPPVYYPVPNNAGEIEQIKVARYRTFDGKELIEPGLTISVFPHYTSRKYTGGYTTSNARPVLFKPYFLGNKGEGFSYETDIKLVVAVQYQDTALEQSQIFNYTVSNEYKVINHDVVDTREARGILKQTGSKNPKAGELQVEINPAEEVLRDYLFILKYVLDDNHTILPWKIKSSQVESIDFPTTAWDKENTDIYFHHAYLVWSLCLYLPGALPKEVKQINGKPIEYININQVLSY